MEKTYLYAYIMFIGKDDVDDFPVEVVTEMLGVQPTRIKRMGERLNELYTRSFTSWEYMSETLETLNVDDVLLPIFNVFHDKTDVINRIKKELHLDVKIAVVITMIDGFTPGLVIYPEFGKFISDIDALIDIDMYVYPFVENEE